MEPIVFKFLNKTSDGWNLFRVKKFLVVEKKANDVDICVVVSRRKLLARISIASNRFISVFSSVYLRVKNNYLISRYWKL